MIFVTVGSQEFPFDRLLKSIDKAVEEKKISESVFAQTGYSTYIPRMFPSVPFLKGDDYTERMRNADLVITHGGTAALRKALKYGRKVIAVPRLKKYHEHVDDHQKQIIEEFSKAGIILGLMDAEMIGEAVKEAESREFSPLKKEEKLVTEIRRLLEELSQS